MVYYFTTRCGNYTIYMGKDKYENEDLIKYGLPEDCWFHVDDLSSAHGKQKDIKHENDVFVYIKHEHIMSITLTLLTYRELSLSTLETRNDTGT